MKRLTAEPQQLFLKLLIYFDKNIVQINHSLTKKKAAVRGMHYQIYPYEFQSWPSTKIQLALSQRSVRHVFPFEI